MRFNMLRSPMTLGRNFMRQTTTFSRFMNHTRQSPIDIETSKAHPEEEIEVATHYKDIKNGTLTLDGRTLIHEYHDGTLHFRNYTDVSSWTSAQFHFHSPSEHTIDGKYFDAEMHMVFLGIDHPGEAAVVGLMFEVNPEAEKDLFLESLQLAKLTKPKDELKGIKASPEKLFGKLSNFENFHYQGGLTTPGYDEIVNWFVFEEPIQIPPEQFETMKAFWDDCNIEGCVKGNARHLQKKGSRVVHKVKHTLKPQEE